MERKLILFDCDGTLYRQPDLPFLRMPFWSDIRERSIGLYSRMKGCQRRTAEADFEELFQEYRGEMSKAFEDHLAIPSNEYFANTWGRIHTPTYMQEPTMRKSTIERLIADGFEVGLLTNAPRVWAEKVLSELSLSEHFEDRIWDGEGITRKPNPASYLAAIACCDSVPEETMMVGDEEKNDVLGPLKLGMTAIRVNPYGKPTRACAQVHDINNIASVLR